MEEKTAFTTVHIQFRESIFWLPRQPGKSIYSYLQTTKLGLTQGEVQERQSIYGRNEVVHEQKKNPFILFIKNVYQSFHWRSDRARHNILFLDVLMADPGEQEWTGVIIIIHGAVQCYPAFLAGMASK